MEIFKKICVCAARIFIGIIFILIGVAALIIVLPLVPIFLAVGAFYEGGDNHCL